MNFLKAFIELRDDARKRFDKCRSELEAGKIDDADCEACKI